MNAHIGDDAASYALGMLDELEQSRIDEHVASCPACAAALAQAFDDVAAIAEAEPQHAPPMSLRPPARMQHKASWWMPAFAAVAAAIAIAVLPSAYFYGENQRMHAAMLADADAMARIASSPHRAVAFAGANANVMYGTDGSWYCVIVRGATKPMQVAWMHDGRQTMLGTVTPHGDVAILYLPKSHRMDQLALVADDQMVGQARLVF
ncbi:MAG TPA: zf-HC2 domain-containing protein [Candidatus Aquilonibacter sp.]|nr:zf-HC2 domain-containing protein [Candidatus Aquilonibacter sp.]